MDSYDFTEKSTYRVRVWTEIEKCCTVPKALRRVAYLDTRDALETFFLLKRGYLPENLLAINRDPVEVALLTSVLKKAGHPTVMTAGIEWTRAVRERLPSGAHILNFDGMGSLHFDKLVHLMRSSILISGASVVAINMLGGREQLKERILLNHMNAARQPSDHLPNMTTFGRQVNPHHAERVRTLIKSMTDTDNECLLHVQSVSWDVYRSISGQPMVWCVAKVVAHCDNDQSWREVERKWCISPICRYLTNPESYRALLREYHSIQKTLEPFNGQTLQQVADTHGSDIALTLDLLCQRADIITATIRRLDDCKSTPALFRPFPAE